MQKVIKWGVIIFIGLLVLSSLSGDEEEEGTQPENQLRQEQTVQEKEANPEPEKPELEVLNWEVKSKKAGSPGNYRTEAWVEGVIENVSDSPAKDITIGARFTHNGQQVSVNFINYPHDELMQGGTWRFRIPCPAADDMVDGAILLTPG